MTLMVWGPWASGIRGCQSVSKPDTRASPSRLESCGLGRGGGEKYTAGIE